MHINIQESAHRSLLLLPQVKHVHRVAVGIGKNIKRSELEIIAGDSGRVVAVKRFADLPNYLDSIRETANSKSFFILSF